MVKRQRKRQAAGLKRKVLLDLLEKVEEPGERRKSH